MTSIPSPAADTRGVHGRRLDPSTVGPIVSAIARQAGRLRLLDLAATTPTIERERRLRRAVIRGLRRLLREVA